MKLLDIGEVSEASGLPASALRYYEDQGLIAPAGRHGLRRQYEPEVLMQLTLISMGKAAGFTLDEIGSIFGNRGRPVLPRDELHQKADALERQMRELGALAKAVRHVANCQAESQFDCQAFQRLMRVNIKTMQRRARKNGGRKAPV